MNQSHTFGLSTWARLVALSLLLGFGLLTGSLLASNTAHAQAASGVTITVSTCDESHLDAAITQANSDNAGDIINFSCSGDIPLTSTLTISGSMTLDGSGQSVTLDGQNQVQVLFLDSGVSFTLNALTIAHGNTQSVNDVGSGIENDAGTLTISNSIFANNSVSGTFGIGGAISNGGMLTISNSTFSGNSAFGSVGGGGGAIDNSGTLTIGNSTFANNSTSGGEDIGGGILNDGTLTISNSTFSGNSAAYGGAIDHHNGTLTISNSTFSGNSAVFGGGFYNSGTLTISNSTFSGNSAGGGGGIDNLIGGTLTISNSTFSGNSANGAEGGGGIDNVSGGTVNINGSIVANNSRGNCSGGVSDQGYNLESGTDCGFTGTGSLQNTDPRLSALANNGGPTQTMALQQGSPAIDHIPTASCPATDQRGVSRPDNGETTCDMGAYEFTDPVDKDLGLSGLPANITVNATSPQGAVVTYTPPTATDESGDNPGPTVSCSPTSGSTFAIGTTTVTCTASDSDDTNSPVSGSFTVTVKPVLSVSVANVNATEGAAFSGVVATGTAYGTTNPLSATITWADGSSSTVSVTPNPDGSYSVSGSHTYAEEGSYALAVSVKDSGSLSASGTGSAKVADAALTLTHFVAGPLGHRSAGVAATFTDADPAGTVSDYTATISWGDGSTSTVKVIKNPFGKGFVLAGAHSYTRSGTYNVTLTVTDQGGSQVSKTVTLIVK